TVIPQPSPWRNDMAAPRWTPPETLTHDDALKASAEILGRPDIPMSEVEDIIRITALGLEWDICLHVYQPKDPARIPSGADGRKVGIFLLHGEGEDHRSMHAVARLLASKYGYK